MASRTGTRRGFTLIELLVVVAIIALLISILLPSLSGARRQAKATVCASNLSQVGKAFAAYLADNNAIYPPAYVYPFSGNGDWSPEDQQQNKQYGYNHWSWFLYSGGQVNPKAFQCPEFDHNGLPRTNPGPDAGDWQRDGQVDDTNGGPPGTRLDKQAPRLAFTCNAAIVPRNKFNTTLSGGPRVNRLVAESEITSPRAVILATEFLNNWRCIAVSDGGGWVSKSHRPINPFFHLSTGSDEYQAPPENGDFIYGTTNDKDTFGLLTYAKVIENEGLIQNTNMVEVNTVGRHHPGGDKLGGTANFLYVDGSVRRKTVLQTIRAREWGDKYYSLTGENEILYGN